MDRELELFRQHRTEQSKYTYFLLAAAASGIALAVRVTGDAILHWSLIPIGMSVVSWGASFYHGCMYLQIIQSLTRTNADLLQVQRGDHPLAGPVPWKQAAGVKMLNEEITQQSETSGSHYRRQFGYLVTGGILFVVWHAIQIALRTAHT